MKPHNICLLAALTMITTGVYLSPNGDIGAAMLTAGALIGGYGVIWAVISGLD